MTIRNYIPALLLMTLLVSGYWVLPFLHYFIPLRQAVHLSGTKKSKSLVPLKANEKPFTIMGFEWDKDIEARMAAGGYEPDSDEIILRKLSAFAKFFDEHGLTTRRLTADDGAVDRGFVLKSNDLTPEGFTVLQKGYEKWHRQAKSPEDVRPWEKALRLVRASE